MQMFSFFHNLAILLFSETVIFIISWYRDFVFSNSVCNHTRDKLIGLPLRGRPIWLSLVRLRTELDSIYSCYHYLNRDFFITIAFFVLILYLLLSIKNPFPYWYQTVLYVRSDESIFLRREALMVMRYNVFMAGSSELLQDFWTLNI